MQKRHPHILQRDTTAFVLIDFQEKFEKAIADFAMIEQRVVTLAKGFNILGLPVFYTEQYPKGLGRTTANVAAQLPDLSPIEKLHFSAVDDLLISHLQQKQVEQIVLAGIEAHVCVLQTALDFQYAGFQVHVAADAVSSRKERDREIAFDRMKSHGINLTAVESILFELLTTAGTDEFRSISKLLK